MSIDWSSVEQETLAHLQALLRFDTTNPPGNEMPLAEYLVGVLDREGISSTLLVPAPGRAAVHARLKGNGSARPVLLLAHMDVVGVEREKWSCDPFGGVLRDGYVYGRGAIDDKGMLTANLMTLLLIKRAVLDAGGALSRDVVFLATSDEESGGEHGIHWLISTQRDLLDAEYALNEGGRTRIIEGGRRYLAIQTAEKISHLIALTARGPAGHAAIPLAGNSIFRLGRALSRLSGYAEPVRLTETTRRFFGGLAPIWPDKSEAEAMQAVASDDATRVEAGAEILSRIPVFNAVLRNGISATLLAGGIRGNVIPAEATAVLNVRTIPGESLEELIERLAAVIDDPAVELGIAVHGPEAPASAPSAAMFEAIAESARALDPGLAVVPYLSTGATDSAHLRRIGISCYGILPFPMPQEDEERMHGHDERVPVKSLHFGTRLIFESVRRVTQPV